MNIGRTVKLAVLFPKVMFTAVSTAFWSFVAICTECGEDDPQGNPPAPPPPHPGLRGPVGQPSWEICELSSEDQLRWLRLVQAARAEGRS